ncbi:MAG: PD-(D/E)XK nuclease family protein [Planctomycetaceae bacterium]|jgi:RecB family exonuclease|nr:PD-(D/E)XK nuclease family protein [Planctomycetaceae bacterium]
MINNKPIERKFLTWNQPLLLTAAKYLIDKFVYENDNSTNNNKSNSKRRFDLSTVVIAFSAHRAITRFEEILVEQVNQLVEDGIIESAWYPPELITFGSLPEKFYEQTFPIANEETQYFAWRRAILNIQKSDPENLKHLLPFQLNEYDIGSGIALGKTFAALHYEIVSENIDFDNVVEKCQELDLPQEEIRWNMLVKLKNEYHQILNDLKIWDLQSARLYAVNNQKESEYTKIYDSYKKNKKQFFLVNLVDMNILQREIVNKFSEFVTALIFAPESYKDYFDEFGCIIPDKWLDEVIPIDDSQIEIVERSDFEPDAVLRRLYNAKNSESSDGKFAAGEISIVAANSETLPFFKRRFKEANIKLSHFKGIELRHSPIYRFLDLLAKFIESQSFSDLAELARHPDMYNFLKQNFNENPEYYKLLKALDLYCNNFIPDKIDGNWKSLAGADNRITQLTELDDVIQKSWQIISNQLIEFENSDWQKIDEQREPPEFWLMKINTILARFYQNNKRMITVNVLEYITIANNKINKIPKELLPKMTFFETINFQLSLLNSEFISPYPDDDAIDMIGWLEAATDDAELLIVTGLNDGFIPSYVIADAFLPDKIRLELKMIDNKRRHARDIYTIIVTLKTRKKDNVILITSRSSIAGDPMIPSRLLFATDDNNPEERMKLTQRIKRFFGETPKQPKIILENSFENILAKSFNFKVPELPILEPQIQKMRVTEFADYARCPYRYYLKHVLKLFPIDDSAEEISPSRFGDLIHETLCEFGRNEIVRDWDDENMLKSWLKDKLLEIAKKNFGDNPIAAVAIQIERAISRLDAFARWQAERRKGGDKILHVEFRLDEKECQKTNFLDVDNKKMFVIGRIDRIDYNEKNNEYTIIDYKTSNSSKSPEDVHKKKNNDEWLDFQLPLYHYILQRTGRFNATINLAYVNLPRNNEVELKIANWDKQDLNDAIEQAKKIVHNIWSNNFPLTVPPPIYSQDYAPICLDNIPR